MASDVACYLFLVLKKGMSISPKVITVSARFGMAGYLGAG
jgi:hypothetical protein